MDRVLQVTSKLLCGGAEAFIMNVYRNIDREQMQFDFLVFHEKREYYEDEIERLGGRIYHVPVMDGANLLRRKKMIGAFFDEHHDYVAIHGHMAALGKDYLRSAAEHGIGRRLAHSHIANFEHTPRNMVKQAFQKGFGTYATKLLACSAAAGKFMYPTRSFEVVNNGIDVGRFAFDPGRRACFRKQLDLPENAKLVGHVGRFELMKNHVFLIDFFAELARLDKDTYLLLAGDGSLRREIEQKVHSSGLDSRVRFLGLVDDMPSFYDGIDVFAMPSLFEGLPFSAIEAQCSGLPCVLSNRISKEAAITDLAEYMPLEAGAASWAKRVESALIWETRNRKAYPHRIATAGYDIRKVAAKLFELYTSPDSAARTARTSP